MPKELSDAELEIYSRQIALQDIDYEGQVKLRNGKACVIGMGGLGSLISLKLVAMGIGCLRMVDRDIVSRSDLHRQYLYDVDAVGLPKVEMAMRKLSRLNPDVALEPIPESLNTTNADQLIAGADVVLDGLDRPEPRYLLNRTCNKRKVPYVFGGAIEAFGNLTTIIPGQTICIECFMPGLKEKDLPKCGVVGVHPSALGIVTSLQVFEAVQLIIGRKPKLLNRLFHIDLRRMDFHSIRIEKLESCPVCGSLPEGLPEPLRDSFIEETCARDGRRNFVITPKKRIVIDLDKLPPILTEKGYRIRKAGDLGITFEQSEAVSTSILKSGTMITQTTLQGAGPAMDVLAAYESILIDGLGFTKDILPED